ncbi:fumarylacetoacetate hydrolase family protein [Aquisalimonas sp.]|uniref:fumarylacetoacetate hydrolase family protein n=1 Tax=Aquisalimonas sp. TaxID=1872621 RepID=UPI0025B84965|nr:fumarylacetoacetate hydrolase family protein [Aquisalimonas sp.]
MRYVSVRTDTSTRWGISAEGAVQLAPRGAGWADSLLELIEMGPGAASAQAERLLRGDGEARDLNSLTLLAPIPKPTRNIICLGLNYADHASESQRAKGQEVSYPEHLVVFTKATTSVTAPYAAIPVDTTITTQLDWEVELAVVIGTGGRNIPEHEAAQHVFGYTVVNDLSARDLQFCHKQFFLGKSLDGGCPMGPWITSADAIADPHDLALWCDVNGQRQQSGYTGDQIFRIPETIASLSRIMTLVPGDIIATGTPSGVGFAQDPPRFLQAGDVVECGVDGIGTIRNRIV